MSQATKGVDRIAAILTGKIHLTSAVFLYRQFYAPKLRPCTYQLGTVPSQSQGTIIRSTRKLSPARPDVNPICHEYKFTGAERVNNPSPRPSFSGIFYKGGARILSPARPDVNPICHGYKFTGAERAKYPLPRPGFSGIFYKGGVRILFPAPAIDITYLSWVQIYRGRTINVS